MACSTGVSNFCTVLSDSPSLRAYPSRLCRERRAHGSLSLACASVLARDSPVRTIHSVHDQNILRPNLRDRAVSTALLPVRWQRSRAISGVSLRIGRLAHQAQGLLDALLGDEAKKGDCSSCTASPCRSVPSNTGSPVVFVKSARTMVSLSGQRVRLAPENHQKLLAASATTDTAAAATHPSNRVDFAAGFDPVLAVATGFRGPIRCRASTAANPCGCRPRCW